MTTQHPTMSMYASRKDWETAMEKWLEKNGRSEDDFFDEDAYDSHGRISRGGLYDAAGHLIPGRLPDYIDKFDYLHEREFEGN